MATCSTRGTMLRCLAYVGELAPRARSVDVKQRYIRVGDELDDDVSVIVPGGVLDAVVLREDAVRNHTIYGTYMGSWSSPSAT